MLKIAVLTVSNSIFTGQKQNESANVLFSLLKQEWDCEISFRIVPDEMIMVVEEMIELIDRERVDLLFTTGGVGVRAEDITPEATKQVVQRLVPGMAEEIRGAIQKKSRHGMLIRALVGTRRNTLVINLPGLPTDVKDCYMAISDQIPNAMGLIQGKSNSSSFSKLVNDLIL